MSIKLTQRSMSAQEDCKEFVLTDEHISIIYDMYEHWTYCESNGKRFSRTCIKFTEKIIDGYDCLSVAESMQEVFERLSWDYDKKYNWALETVYHGQPNAPMVSRSIEYESSDE